MSFFNETAEELVNSVCQELIEGNTFPDTDPMTDPETKELMVKAVKRFDKTIKKHGEAPFDSFHITLMREQEVLKKLARIFAEGVKLYQESFLKEYQKNHPTPPPKSTHRQPNPKRQYNHLRLVVNQ